MHNPSIEEFYSAHSSSLRVAAQRVERFLKLVAYGAAGCAIALPVAAFVPSPEIRFGITLASLALIALCARLLWVFLRYLSLTPRQIREDDGQGVAAEILASGCLSVVCLLAFRASRHGKPEDSTFQMLRVVQNDLHERFEAERLISQARVPRGYAERRAEEFAHVLGRFLAWQHRKLAAGETR